MNSVRKSANLPQLRWQPVGHANLAHGSPLMHRPTRRPGAVTQHCRVDRTSCVRQAGSRSERMPLDETPGVASPPRFGSNVEDADQRLHGSLT